MNSISKDIALSDHEIDLVGGGEITRVEAVGVLIAGGRAAVTGAQVGGAVGGPVGAAAGAVIAAGVTMIFAAAIADSP